MASSIMELSRYRYDRAIEELDNARLSLIVVSIAELLHILTSFMLKMEIFQKRYRELSEEPQR